MKDHFSSAFSLTLLIVCGKDAATNRLITSGSTPTTYDAAGNITTDTKFRNLKYEYDANGRQSAVKLINNTAVQTSIYDCAGLRVQTTASGVTRTMVYDVFGQQVADYNGGSLERENIYRGGQLLTVVETPTAPAPSDDASLAGAPNGTLIKKTHIAQLRQRATSGSGTQGSGGGGGVMYVLSDVQGSSRAVMNNSGVGTSAIIARHDYLPFGEEIGSGIGRRTGAQGYSASDNNRHKYALTERDNVTGLDHTWFRKYESLAGRWTSPDPLAGNIGNPQSFNRYSYAHNDPVNLVDPSGLCIPLNLFFVLLVDGVRVFTIDLGTVGYINCNGGGDRRPRREPPERGGGPRERPKRNHAEPKNVDACVIFTAILLGGIARLLLAFRSQVASLPPPERSTKRQKLLSLAFANVIGSSFGFFCLVTRAFEPLETLFGVVLVTSLLEIAIRNGTPRARG